MNVFVLIFNELCTYLSDKTNVRICINTFDIIFFYYNSNFSIQYIVNLFIILGNFFIHKCKFLGKNPVLSIFLVDYNSYVLSLMGIKKQKIFQKSKIAFNV